MVRLKFDENGTLIMVTLKFQFHYGSIKIFAVCYLLNYTVCFNSTMVRLKYTEKQTLFNEIAKFQFHYGSIKIRPFRFNFDFV